ncbi:MAG TPA: alpha/beta hydrolase [Jatrophihabitantaceae bacterium]|nr:alpha/beta hydrolase [Jatrophihabitantaceae bacterium]
MITHRYGAHQSQFGELSIPAGQRRAGTIVIIHGGFWRARYDLSLGRPLAADLVQRGYTVWNLEYRRIGDGGGWPMTFDDVAAGIDLLADLDVDPAHVVAVGHSAGGHLAAWAAGRGEPRVALTGVVSQAGVLSLVRCAQEGLGDGAALDLMGGSADELPEQYLRGDPLAAVPISAPVLCVHARADENVPFTQSVGYVEAADAAGGSAVLQEASGDHFTLIDPASPDWAMVVDALPGLLAG